MHDRSHNLASAPINITPSWLNDGPNPIPPDAAVLLEHLSAAAAAVQPASEDHRFCAIDLRWMKPQMWLKLLNDDVVHELTMPVLCLTTEPSLHDWNADPQVKQHQFYVQLGEQYGVLQLVSYRTLGDELQTIFGVKVAGPDRHNPDNKDALPSIAERVTSLKTAIERTVRTATKAVELTFGCAPADAVTRMSDLFAGDIVPGDPDIIAGALNWLADEVTSDVTRQMCLLNLASCYHIGRYRRAEAHASQRLGWPSTQTTSQKIVLELRSAWREWIREGGHATSQGAKSAAAAFARMRLFFLFRDLARSLVSGGAEWQQPTAGAKPRRLRLVLLDDNPGDVALHLECLKTHFWADAVAIEKIEDTAWSEFSNWFQRSWLDPTLTREFPEDDGLEQAAISASERGSDDEDVVFLVDVDFEGRDRGPELVTWIRSWKKTLASDSKLRQYLSPAANSERGRNPPGPEKQQDVDWNPRILILTNARASESIQLSMNLGVETYVFKDRVYSLPAWLTHIRDFTALKSLRDSSADFRSIHKLPMRMLAKLSSHDTKECITGSPANIVRERRWLENLPKADLHFHIGTSISTATIDTLAGNTLWYAHQSFKQKALGEVFKRLWSVLARSAKRKNHDPRKSWFEVIHAEADGLNRLEYASKQRAHMRPQQKAQGRGFERLIGVLQTHYPSLDTYDIVASIVVALGYLESQRSGVDPADIPLQRLALLFPAGGTDAGEGIQDGGRREAPPDPRVDAAVALWDRIKDATRAHRWEGTYTRIEIQQYQDVRASDLPPLMRTRRGVVRDFVAESYDSWKTAAGENAEDRRDASEWVAKADLSLATLVEIPESGTDGNLEAYLRGAALLGAEHLQYPENIVLAALDIVDQNVRDNVLYSEIRCAPTGYGEAGLDPQAATDILCSSFDAAEALYGSLYGRWVMTNVLLGAKRHKGANDVKAVVALLTRYLHYPYGLQGGKEYKRRPKWWRQTRVIGFDLSGREDMPTANFNDALRPLFEDCAAITVHAGEAASAEKIWEAVYKLGARRIGHGLKLREHRRLLDFCLTEGICLELCPISNCFTNDFKAVDDGAPDRPRVPSSPNHYPLKEYLDAGLRVAVSTDNRYLHRRHQLTDEFLQGAAMVGGLTRLEVLRVIKNGFYNAFLGKGELRELLGAVDEMIFKGLAEEDDRAYGPETA